MVSEIQKNSIKKEESALLMLKNKNVKLIQLFTFSVCYLKIGGKALYSQIDAPADSFVGNPAVAIVLFLL